MLFRVVFLSLVLGALCATARRARTLLAAAQRTLADERARAALAHWARDAVVVAVTAVSLYGMCWKYPYLPAPLHPWGEAVAHALDAWIWKWNLGYIYTSSSGRICSRLGRIVAYFIIARL